VLDKETARRNLEERREKLVERTGRIQQHLRRLPDADSQERVTEGENDEVLERLDDTERAELARVTRALERLESGTYETCERCGEAIQPGRLEALPETSTCVDCA
jgi:RNA polymerase-binding transcription factor DksA